MINDEIRQKIEEIKGKMECPKGFKCLDSGFEGLCKARDFGVDGFLYCLEDKPFLCAFALPFSFIYLCRCPLRVFIKKKIGK